MALYLVRHAKAGSRHDWTGPDEKRPLSKRGRRQAEGLVAQLGYRGVERIVSSPSKRCVDTVRPLADTLGLEIETVPELDEGATRDQAMGLVHRLASTTAVVCSHGDVIGVILEALADDGVDLPPERPCAKGATWELQVDADRVVKAQYLPPPG
ncbi:MAG: SixA phosphatase family protein [Acidimicrobiales bacterium]